jgi:hypothetical protein
MNAGSLKGFGKLSKDNIIIFNAPNFYRAKRTAINKDMARLGDELAQVELEIIKATARRAALLNAINCVNIRAKRLDRIIRKSSNG